MLWSAVSRRVFEIYHMKTCSESVHGVVLSSIDQILKSVDLVSSGGASPHQRPCFYSVWWQHPGHMSIKQVVEFRMEYSTTAVRLFERRRTSRVKASTCALHMTGLWSIFTNISTPSFRVVSKWNTLAKHRWWSIWLTQHYCRKANSEARSDLLKLTKSKVIIILSRANRFISGSRVIIASPPIQTL